MNRSNVRFLLLGLILGVVASQAWVFFRALPAARPDASKSSPAPPPSGASAPPASLSNDIKVQNTGVVPLTKVLPADRALATVNDGVSFYTLGFLAKEAGATARLKVKAFASAVEPNVAVVAVFRAGQSAPLALVSKPLSGNRREPIELSADIPAVGTTPIYLDFRIGPGKPGTITFNGPEGASDPVATEIRVTE